MSKHFEAFKRLIDEHPAELVVLATYTRVEFAELRPGEDYDKFKRLERAFIEELAAAGYQDRVVFQTIDSVGYYRWLAAKHLPNTEEVRAAYAAELYRSSESAYK